MEGLDLMRLDGDGNVREFTAFFRPLPGLGALTHVLATRIARRRSRALAFVIGLLVRPLVVLTRVGDRMALPLLERGLGNGPPR